MRDERHYRNILTKNPTAGVGFNLAAAAVYAARHGVCETAQMSSDECRKIMRMLKSRYGDTLTTGEVSELMDRAAQSRAAAALGSMTSERKAESSRRNGRKGGRPRKDTREAGAAGGDGVDLTGD